LLASRLDTGDADKLEYQVLYHMIGCKQAVWALVIVCQQADWTLVLGYQQAIWPLLKNTPEPALQHDQQVHVAALKI
jgi:hypothetical protein